MWLAILLDYGMSYGMICSTPQVELWHEMAMWLALIIWLCHDHPYFVASIGRHEESRAALVIAGDGDSCHTFLGAVLGFGRAWSWTNVNIAANNLQQHPLPSLPMSSSETARQLKLRLSPSNINFVHGFPAQFNCFKRSHETKVTLVWRVMLLFSII